ncbi:hypothetical protein QP938_11940 [Porticoccaceae bacterium LTM1]|nr:hypothetical protein QP938_11940 [Porticoccaceae bacterium LTM1]
MSSKREQQLMLTNLVAWCDALADLQAMDCFLESAIIHILEGDGFGEKGQSLLGLQLFSLEKKKRLAALKEQLQQQCQSFKQIAANDDSR